MSLFWKGILVVGLFHLLVAQSFAAEVQRQTVFTSNDIDSYSLTSSNRVWFHAHNKFMETEFVNGQWVNRRFVVPEGSELESKLIYDFAVTDQHLWMIEADKVTAFELSESAPFIKNKLELPLAYAVGDSLDMTVALDNSGVVSNGRDQYVSTVWVFTLDNGQIKLQELDPPLCGSPGSFRMTSHWLVVGCESYENVVYRKNGLHYELFKTIRGQVLNLNPGNSTLIVYDPDQSKIVTLALPSLTEISSIALVTAVYQSSKDSLFLVDKVDDQQSAATRQIIRLDKNGHIVEQLKFSSFNEILGLVSDKDFSSFLHKVGDRVFLGFYEWLKNPESGLYEFRGNTWQHRLGVSHHVAESFPQVNAVVFGGSTKQIWLGEPAEMPVVRGYVQLMTETFQQVDISATANHEYNWWFAGIRHNTLYLGLWTPEHQLRQIELPYPHGFSSGIYDMNYFKAEDTLLIHTYDGIFMQCSNVSDIETSNCQPVPLPENMQYKVATQHGLLVYQKAASDSTLTASMFALTSAGLQKGWSLALNEEQSQIVPMVYIKEQDIVLGRKAQIRLSDVAGTFVDTPSGPSFYGSCLLLGQTDVLCPNNGFEFFRFNKDFTAALAIRPNQQSSLRNLDGALRHVTQNGYALTSSKDQILWHRLDLPQINFTDKDILVNAFQDQNIVLDLNSHLTPLSGLQIKADETAIPHLFSQPFLKLKTGDASWQLDTSNDLALYNPTFSLGFSFSNELWDMNLPYKIALHNINDAPRVKSGQFVNDLDIGDTYMLDFFEVFEDIDRETLSFQISTLPAGFVREDTRIMATPTSSGSYSFSITATDPAGLSVSATFSGVVKGKGSTDSTDSSGGGSFGHWSVLLLCALVWIRRSTMKF